MACDVLPITQFPISDLRFATLTITLSNDATSKRCNDETIQLPSTRPSDYPTNQPRDYPTTRLCGLQRTRLILNDDTRMGRRRWNAQRQFAQERQMFFHAPGGFVDAILNRIADT